MTSVSIVALVAILAVSIISISNQKAFADGGFTGDYDPANWNFSTEGNGFVDTDGTPNFIELDGSDGACEGECSESANTDYTIEVPSDRVITFDWDYTTLDCDGPSFDPAGYLLNGDFFQFTDDSGANSQSGHIQVPVNSGDIFGFRVFTTDNECGRGVITSISNFNGHRVGGSCDDCTAPTLGYDSMGRKLVDGGFTYNGKVTDANYYYTPYPLINATIGEENIAELKIFDESGYKQIRHVELGFGLRTGEVMSESKATIIYDIDSEGNGVVSQTDPENAIDDDTLRVTHQAVKCTTSSVDDDCLLVKIYHTFRAPLDYDIVGTVATDEQRNSWQNYFNHGIHIIGDSMNPAKEYTGINDGVIYHLTQTDKTSAVDDLGNSWSFNYGVWNLDYIPVVRDAPSNINEKKIEAINKLSSMTPQEISDLFGYDRNHVKFVDVKNNQLLVAKSVMDKLCPDCTAKPYGEINNTFYYEIPEFGKRSTGSGLDEKAQHEADLASESLSAIYEKIYHHDIHE